MTPTPTAKDLIVVVADADAEKAIVALLQRRQSLGIRKISYDIRRHVQRDPGCRTAVDSFLRPEIKSYRQALVVFDWEGAGAEDQVPEEIEVQVENCLSRAGWAGRCAAVVIQPELEAWVWSDSPHVPETLGWKDRHPSMQEWVKTHTRYWPDGCVKPTRPKEAMAACLREVRKSASPAFFETLAEHVSVSRCSDRAFAKFKSVLARWYGESAPAASSRAVREEQLTYGQPSSPLHHLGNKNLLRTSWIAFYCSVRCPGNLILKSYDLARRWQAEGQPIISGFHSPVEKEVLRIMLRSQAQVCIVLARGLPKRIPAEFRKPLEDGRLLLVSPFDAKTKRASQATAVRRNQVAADLASRIFVAYAATGSKTEALCQGLAATGKPCLTFDDPKTANLKSAGFAIIPN